MAKGTPRGDKINSLADQPSGGGERKKEPHVVRKTTKKRKTEKGGGKTRGHPRVGESRGNIQ